MQNERTDADKDEEEAEAEAVAAQALLTAISGKYTMDEDDDDDLIKKQQQPMDAWNLSLQHALDTYQSSTSFTSSMVDSERLQREKSKRLSTDAQRIAAEIIQEKEAAAGIQLPTTDLKVPDRNTSLSTTTPPPPDLSRLDNYRKVHPGAIAMGGLTPQPSADDTADDQTVQVGDTMHNEKMSSHLLMDAVLVEDSPEQSSLPQEAVAAVPVQEMDDGRGGFCSVFYDRRVACLFIIMIIIIATLAAGLSVLFLENSDGEDAIPTMAPVEPIPTAPPTARFDFLAALLQDFFDDPLPWEDSTTPQYEALDWLANEDAWLPTNLQDIGDPTQIILERYVLAVVYMSFGGDNWAFKTEFLNSDLQVCDWSTLYCHSTDECETLGVECGSSGQFVTGLSLSKFLIVLRTCCALLLLTVLLLMLFFLLDGIGALGTIPTEVGLLSSLEFLWLDGNALFGSIPAELFELQNLESVSVAANELSGTLPSEIGLATELFTLDLANNLISGSLENAVAPRVTFLSLEGNLLDGTIPLDFSSMTNMDYLNLGDNDLTGPLPANLVNLEALAVLSLFDNVGLSGTVPPAYSSFNLSLLYLEGTSLTNLEEVFCSTGLLEFEEFYADCGGTPAQVQCWCCTHCCDDIVCDSNN